MFRLREKLKYMALGALITLVGFVLGNMNEDTEAQSGSETINELTVRNMIVLEDIRVIDDDDVPQVVITWDENGGKVSAHSLRGHAALGVGEDGGLIQVGNAEGKIGAQVTMNENGGIVVVRSTSCYGPGGIDVADSTSLLVGQLGGIAGVTDRNASGASLTLGREGGGVTIFPIAGVAGKGGAALSIDEGDGVIFTRDRFGKLRALEE